MLPIFVVFKINIINGLQKNVTDVTAFTHAMGYRKENKMKSNQPNFLIDKKASILIVEAKDWINSQMNGNCEAILAKLEDDPPQFKRLVVTLEFERTWRNHMNLNRLKAELRGWMNEWKAVIDGI